MPDQHPNRNVEQLKPLSLESAILDVAPRVTEPDPKPAPAQQPTQRPGPSGRISLRPQQ
ncbi:MAG: hypothetical protein AAFY46_05115 [Planctomycetota bacterium]